MESAENSGKKNPKVLVASPIYDKMKYCFREFVDSLKAIDYDNFDILLMDNSKGNEFFEELKMEKGIIALKDNTNEEKNVLRLVSSRNKILEYALANNYDYALMMDADVIAPKEIVKELLASDKEIISGIYFNDFLISGKIKKLPVCWKVLTEEQFNEAKKLGVLPNYAKSRFDIRRNLTGEEVNKNETEEVFICSAGCMMLSKKVLENKSVRYGAVEKESILMGDDLFFLEEARKAGFKIHCNTKVKCRHLTEGKFGVDEKGNKIHPMYE